MRLNVRDSLDVLSQVLLWHQSKAGTGNTDGGMSTGDWFVFAFLVVLMLLAFRALPSIWRGEHSYLNEDMPSYWVWGQQLWLGSVRSSPALVVLMSLAVVGLPIFLLGAEIAGGVLLGGAPALIFVVLAVITLFNQPKVIVPPPFRSQQGALSTWLRRRRAAAERRTARKRSRRRPRSR